MQENNDIVKRAKNMSAMAFSMYQFTKGEGELKTTQDLFTQAEYFAEEANRLYKVIRQFSYQVSTFTSIQYMSKKAYRGFITKIMIKFSPVSLYSCVRRDCKPVDSRLEIVKQTVIAL